ncbi:hypothetical protein PilKf_02553 [Pillotina sp. SPG140]
MAGLFAEPLDRFIQQRNQFVYHVVVFLLIPLFIRFFNYNVSFIFIRWCLFRRCYTQVKRIIAGNHYAHKHEYIICRSRYHFLIIAYSHSSLKTFNALHIITALLFYKTRRYTGRYSRYTIDLRRYNGNYRQYTENYRRYTGNYRQYTGNY